MRIFAFSTYHITESRVRRALIGYPKSGFMCHSPPSKTHGEAATTSREFYQKIELLHVFGIDFSIVTYFVRQLFTSVSVKSGWYLPRHFAAR